MDLLWTSAQWRSIEGFHYGIQGSRKKARDKRKRRERKKRETRERENREKSEIKERESGTQSHIHEEHPVWPAAVPQTKPDPALPV